MRRTITQSDPALAGVMRQIGHKPDHTKEERTMTLKDLCHMTEDELEALANQMASVGNLKRSAASRSCASGTARP